MGSLRLPFLPVSVNMDRLFRPDPHKDLIFGGTTPPAIYPDMRPSECSETWHSKWVLFGHKNSFPMLMSFPRTHPHGASSQTKEVEFLCFSLWAPQGPRTALNTDPGTHPRGTPRIVELHISLVGSGD